MYSQHESIKKIKKGVVISYIGIFISIILTLIYTPWMISQIGNADYGIFTLASSLINIFLFDFGLSLAVHKKISENIVTSDKAKISSYVGVFFKIYFILGIFILATFSVIYFLLPSIYKGMDSLSFNRFSNVFLILSIYSAISFMAIPQNGLLKAFEKFGYLRLLDLLHRILSVTLVVIALLCGMGLYGVVIGSCLSGMLIVLIKYLFIKFGLKVIPKYDMKVSAVFRDIYSISFWGAFIGFSQRFIFTLTPTILGIFASVNEIAIFGIIASLESNFYTIGAVLNGYFVTKTTDLLRNNNLHQLEGDMINVGKFVLSFVGLFVIGFIIIGYDFIILWVGDYFSLAYLGTILVIVPTYFYLPHTISNDILVASNEIKYQGYIYAAMGLLNILLSSLLSYLYGAVGASLSIAIVYSFRNISMSILYKKKIYINWKKYYLKTYVKVVPIIILLIIIGIPANKYFGRTNILNLFLRTVFITFIYTLTICCLMYRSYIHKIFTYFWRKSDV